MTKSVNEIINEAIASGNKWEVSIECDDENGTILKSEKEYDSIDFINEGLPLAILANAFTESQIDLKCISILWPILPENLYLRKVKKVQVSNGSNILYLNEMNQENAKDMVKKYIDAINALRNDNTRLSDDDIMNILSDAFGSNTNHK